MKRIHKVRIIKNKKTTYAHSLTLDWVGLQLQPSISTWIKNYFQLRLWSDLLKLESYDRKSCSWQSFCWSGLGGGWRCACSSSGSRASRCEWFRLEYFWEALCDFYSNFSNLNFKILQNRKEENHSKDLTLQVVKDTFHLWKESKYNIQTEEKQHEKKRQKRKHTFQSQGYENRICTVSWQTLKTGIHWEENFYCFKNEKYFLAYWFSKVQCTLGLNRDFFFPTSRFATYLKSFSFLTPLCPFREEVEELLSTSY